MLRWCKITPTHTRQTRVFLQGKRMSSCCRRPELYVLKVCIRQPASQPASQASQPASQSVSQPANQSANQPISHFIPNFISIKKLFGDLALVSCFSCLLLSVAIVLAHVGSLIEGFSVLDFLDTPLAVHCCGCFACFVAHGI